MEIIEPWTDYQLLWLSEHGSLILVTPAQIMTVAIGIQLSYISFCCNWLFLWQQIIKAMHVEQFHEAFCSFVLRMTNICYTLSIIVALEQLRFSIFFIYLLILFENSNLQEKWNKVIHIDTLKRLFTRAILATIFSILTHAIERIDLLSIYVKLYHSGYTVQYFGDLFTQSHASGWAKISRRIARVNSS